MRILFVAMPFSIHTARWISQVNDKSWDINLTASMPFKPLHEDINNITYHVSFYNNIFQKVKGNIYSSPALPFFSFIESPLLKKLFRKFAGILGIEKSESQKLADLIIKLKPDIIHSMETQHAGYLVSEAKKRVKGPFPVWIHSNWGIDLHYFGELQDHIGRIRETLTNIDVLLVEGKRDEVLARNLGFEKKVYRFPSVGGGFIIPSSTLTALSSRNKILIKGNQDIIRRGIIAIKAVEKCIDLLDNYEIVLYSASEDTIKEAESFFERTGKRITVCSSINHEQMLKLNSEARINLCVNLSDGLPNAMLEAMLMGALPIQSNTSVADEWIDNGKNGFLVPPENTDQIAMALRMALTDNELCEAAGSYNRALIAERLEYNKIRKEVIRMYEDVCVKGKIKEKK
jgi:glycosyltransferase involved in cell wall biosynthesis